MWTLQNTERKKQSDKKHYEHTKHEAAKANVSYGDYCTKRATKTRAKGSYDKNGRNRERRANDTQFKIRCNLSTRLREFLRLTNGTKACGTMKLVGCTQDFLIKHLESQLLDGENLKDYSIDHIFPMGLYLMDSAEEQMKCMNYTNLRPQKLYGIGGNTSKGNSLPTLKLAQTVSRNCWPTSICENDLN
jgi:hypothetical protein